METLLSDDAASRPVHAGLLAADKDCSARLATMKALLLQAGVLANPATTPTTKKRKGAAFSFFRSEMIAAVAAAFSNELDQFRKEDALHDKKMKLLADSLATTVDSMSAAEVCLWQSQWPRQIRSTDADNNVVVDSDDDFIMTQIAKYDADSEEDDLEDAEDTRKSAKVGEDRQGDNSSEDEKEEAESEEAEESQEDSEERMKISKNHTKHTKSDARSKNDKKERATTNGGYKYEQAKQIGKQGKSEKQEGASMVKSHGREKSHK